MRSTLFLVLLGGCTNPGRTSTFHYGGEIAVRIEPLSEPGLSFEGTFPGAEGDEQESLGSCVSWYGAEVWDRAVQPPRSWIDFCEPDVPIAGVSCFDRARVDVSLTESEEGVNAFVYVYDASGFDRDTYFDVPIQVDEWSLGAAGGFTGTFEVDHPCVGDGPVEHSIEVDWAFDESTEFRYRPRRSREPVWFEV